MLDSNGPRDEAVRFFAERFGVSREVLDALTFTDRGDEIWACRSAPPPGIHSVRAPGLRALRRQGAGLKPTSTFLAALGDRITTSRVDLDRVDLHRLLLGQRIPSQADVEDGHVALCFRGDVLGCGRIRGGLLQALIPTGRRRELLAALAAERRD